MGLIDLRGKVNNTPRFLRMRQTQKEISLAWLLQQRVRNASGRGVENRWDVESEKLCRMRKEEDFFGSTSLPGSGLASS